MLAAVGRLVLTAGPSGSLALIDLETHGRTRFVLPTLGLPGERAVVGPGGRLVAIPFADPAYRGGSAQSLDIWLLDTRTRRLRRLPGMPAEVALKATSMTWTRSGRLVLLAESGGRSLVAVWRPGQRRLAVRTVRLPRRDGGSDAFAIDQPGALGP